MCCICHTLFWMHKHDTERICCSSVVYIRCKLLNTMKETPVLIITNSVLKKHSGFWASGHIFFYLILTSCHRRPSNICSFYFLLLITWAWWHANFCPEIFVGWYYSGGCATCIKVTFVKHWICFGFPKFVSSFAFNNIIKKHWS